MRKYKLLKDLPTFKAGQMFELCNDGLWQIDENGALVVMAYARATLDKFSNILDEWFEEVKENKVWRPKKGGMYYYIWSDGTILSSDYFASLTSKKRLEIGNCFETADDAERAIKKLAALQRLRRRGLKFDGFTAPCESKVCARKHEGITRFMLDSTLVDSKTFKDLELLFGKEE